MSEEIERRFLVLRDLLPDLHGGQDFLQAYISKDPWVRFRIRPDGATLTIKGVGDIRRAEVNIPVPLEEAKTAVRLFGKDSLRKTRTIVTYAGKDWEIDEFHGPLHGLWLAEIELRAVDETFVIPPWLGREVTCDSRYSNAWLAEHGLPSDHGDVKE